MVEVGIPKLDDFLDGGIPQGKNLLFYIEPGVEGEIFGMQALYHNLKQGKKGVFITSTSDPDMVRGYLREFGWDVEEFGENLAIVDAYSSMIGMKTEEKYYVEDPENIEKLDEVITQAIDDFRGGLLTWGSLSALIDMHGEDKIMEYVDKWNKYMMLNDAVGIYNFTAWPYSEETLKKVKEEMFDAVINISGIAERIIFGQYYAVLKCNWAETKEKAIMFKVTRPGGVKAFIPKVLITGPFDAGKSSFVHSLSTRAVSVDRLDTTVALDHGHIDYKGFSADIFGTPGQERFDPILKLLGGKAMGVFLVVDSTKPEEYGRAKKMLESTETFGLPYVVIANKQDMKGALKPDELRKAMKLPKDVPVLPAVATEKKGVFEAFETLIDMITEVK